MTTIPDLRFLAEAVCVATKGHECAATDGLCAEGAWEAAMAAVRALDLAQLPEELADERPTERV